MFEFNQSLLRGEAGRERRRSGADDELALRPNTVITALRYGEMCFTRRMKESHSQEITSDVLFRADQLQGLPPLGSERARHVRPKASTQSGLEERGNGISLP